MGPDETRRKLLRICASRASQPPPGTAVLGDYASETESAEESTPHNPAGNDQAQGEQDDQKDTLSDGSETQLEDERDGAHRLISRDAVRSNAGGRSPSPNHLDAGPSRT